MGAGYWQCLALRPDGSPSWLAVTRSDRYGDGERVTRGEDEALGLLDHDVACVVRYDEQQRVVAVEVTPTDADKSLPLWFVELGEPTAYPPAVHLMAFAGHGVTAGTLVAEDDLGDTDVASGDQLGALRWYPSTGEVDQIYVSPDWRRRGVASTLMMAGGTLSVARGWPRVWGDGQRTELGERWRNASPWAARASALTHVAPPMTPAVPGPTDPAGGRVPGHRPTLGR